MDCPDCGGNPLGLPITGCVYDALEPDTLLVVRLMDMAEQGAWPVLAGILDQAEPFLSALEFWQGERAEHYREKHG